MNTSTTTTTFLLAGDIGGTNSRLRLYAHGESKHKFEREYRNQTYLTDKEDDAFERLIIHRFLKESNLINNDNCEIIAVLACAGPVKDNKVYLTNLDITIDGNSIKNNNGEYLSKVKTVRIINDFLAQGYGCLDLDNSKVDDLVELTDSSLKKDETAPKVCVGAGTGLGECFLTPNGKGSYTCFPSEGGHVEFNPRSALESELRISLMHEFKSDTRISVERVVSGLGIANVYNFLYSHPNYNKFVDEKAKNFHDNTFKTAGDNQGGVVAEASKENKICADAMDIMMRYVSLFQNLVPRFC